MPHVPVRVAGLAPSLESHVKPLDIQATVALLSTALCLCAGLTYAQSAAPSTDPASKAAATPLQLQVPTQPINVTAPAEASDNAIVDAQDNAGDDARRGPQVHGSVTAGIGYSRGYGTSTLTATDLDISGESDSGRTYDVQIHLMQSKGPGFGP